MDSDIERILRDLNSISRMAIIEEAYQTEKMLCNYSKILKYRYGQQEKTVTVSMELSILKMLFGLYEAKSKGLFQFSIENIMDTNAFFIPHYVLLTYMDYVLTFLENHSIKSVDIALNLQDKKDTLDIQFILTGSVIFKDLMKELEEPPKCNDYTCLAFAKSRWNQLFGRESILVETRNHESLILHFLINSL
jgi:LytS/YehU family sensor histidine kinase